MARRIEYVLAQNHLGRVGTISVQGRLTGGLLLRPGREPLQVSFAISQYRQGYARSVGQGPLVWQDLDPTTTSPVALSENMEGGFIVEPGAGLSVVELECRLEFCIHPSVFPWVCSPEQEAERRRTAPESVDELTEQALDLGASYPIECTDSVRAEAAGVMILNCLDGDKSYSATLRIVCDELFDQHPNELSLFRFARPVGIARRP